MIQDGQTSNIFGGYDNPIPSEAISRGRKVNWYEQGSLSRDVCRYQIPTNIPRVNYQASTKSK